MKRFAGLFTIFILTLCFSFTVSAADYTNSETDYEAIIEDDADLLEDADTLLAVMTPITD